MDRRKPPTDEPKKPMTASSRLAAARTAASPTTSRTNALSSRTAGSTINKPPTRPVTSSVRKPAGRGGEDGATADGDENKRPARMPTVGTTTSRAPRVEPSTDKTRRSTLGAAASAPPKRPTTTSSRMTPMSPSKARTSASSISKPTTSQSIRSPTSASTVSSGSAARPVSRDTIPEEPEIIQELPPPVGIVSVSNDSATESPRSPPKLEIRSLNSSTPALKPQAASDAELDKRPKLIARHSRTQSVTICRPLSAPGLPIDGDGPGAREMEALQNMLRERAARDSMSEEVKGLRVEIERLQQENHILTEASKTERPFDPEADAAKERAITKTLNLKHATELEELRMSHQTAMSSLESTHAFELRRIRSELDTQRSKSSKLEGVESRIQAVEAALRDSRVRASSNERHLQETIDEKDADREQLASVVEDLKKEIDKCQAQLDADVAQQEKEKEEALKAMEELKKELDAEKSQNKDTVQKLEKQKLDIEQQTKETVESIEKEVEDLKQAAADAEKTAQALQDELEDVRNHNLEQSEKSRSVLEESESTVESLRKEMEKLKDEHSTELQQAKKTAEDIEKVANDLESELEALRKQREAEQQKIDELNSESQKVFEDLQDQIRKLEQAGSDGTRVIEDLQTKLQEMEHLKSELEAKHEAEQRDLQSVIENLQSDIGNLQQTHSDALAQKDKEAEALNGVVEDLQSKTAALLQQLEDVKTAKEESFRYFNETIESLRGEASRHKEHASAKESESTDLTRVVEELQSRIQEQQRASEGVRVDAEEETARMSTAMEGLQNEIQTLQHQVQDEKDARAKGDVLLNELQEKHEQLGRDHEQLSNQHEQVQLQHFESTRSLGERDERIEELTTSLSDAATAKSEAQDSRSSLQDEMKVLQKVLETFQQDAAEKETHHANSLAKLRKELEDDRDTKIKSVQDEHSKAMDNLRETLTAEYGLSAVDLQKRVETLSIEKESLERKLGDVEMRHNRELEEESQKHEAAYRDLQNSFAQARETQARRLSEQSTRQAATISELQETVAALKESQATLLEEQGKEHDDTKRQLQDTIEGLEKDHVEAFERATEEHKRDIGALTEGHAEAVEKLGEEHKKHVEELKEKHAAQINEVEEEAAKRIVAARAEKTQLEETNPVTVRADENDASRRAVVSLKPDIPRGVEEAETPATPSGGLAHVFVNREERRERDSQGRRLSETPLAYASDEENLSPTPAYPKDGKRAGAEVAPAVSWKRKVLEKENLRLLHALKAAHDELEAVKAAATSKERSIPEEPSSQQIITEASIDDPFAPQPGLQPDTSNDAYAPVPATPDRPQTEETKLTLEGTLESLRVQTEHLLEFQDDIIAENRRFSRKLAMRSQRNTPMKSSPLRAAS